MRIFALYLDGYGASQIARILNRQCDIANRKLSGSRFQMFSDDYEQAQSAPREKRLQLIEEIT